MASAGRDGNTGKFHPMFRELNIYPSETLPKNCRGRNTSKLIQQNADTNTRQRNHKKINFQANVTDEHRCKNPQQNTSKLNTPVSHISGRFFTICCCRQVASVVSDSVRPYRRQPTRLHHPWDSPGKSTGVGCHFLLQCMKVKRESEVAQLCLTL